MRLGRRTANAKALREIQSDYERTFSTPHGRRVMQDLLLMWGFYGDGPGRFSQHRDAALWILDRMGLNHIDNLDKMTDAILRITRVMPENDLESEYAIPGDIADDDVGGSWQRPAG